MAVIKSECVLLFQIRLFGTRRAQIAHLHLTGAFRRKEKKNKKIIHAVSRKDSAEHITHAGEHRQWTTIQNSCCFSAISNMQMSVLWSTTLLVWDITRSESMIKLLHDQQMKHPKKNLHLSGSQYKTFIMLISLQLWHFLLLFFSFEEEFRSHFGRKFYLHMFTFISFFLRNLKTKRSWLLGHKQDADLVLNRGKPSVWPF